MTPQEYDSQIQSLRNQIASKQAQIRANENTISEHQSNIIKDNGCKGKIGKKKTECQATNDWRNQQISSLGAQNAQLKKDIQSLESSINKLVADREAAAKTANEVSKELASIGLTTTAVQTKAQGEAQASIEASKIVAQAQGEAVRSSADVDAKTKQTMTMVIAGVAVLVVIVVGFILWKKYKK